MWEEDPRYQQAVFRITLVVVAAGILALAVLSFLNGTWQPLLDWLVPLALGLFGWLVIVGSVAMTVKIIHGFARWRAKK